MNVTNGSASRSLAELVDIYPTLCDLADIPVPAFLEGTSLVPVLNDVNAEVKDVAISQFPHQHNGRRWMGYAIRTDRFRYVEWLDTENGDILDRELYDHLIDPEENENVAGSPERSETVSLLHEKLRQAIVIPVAERGVGF